MFWGRGVEVFKKDSLEGTGQYMTWTWDAFDRWVLEFIEQHPELPCEPVQMPGSIYYCTMPRTLLILLSRALLQNKHTIWSSEEDNMELRWDEEQDYIESFGMALQRMADNLEEDEFLMMYLVQDSRETQKGGNAK